MTRGERVFSAVNAVFLLAVGFATLFPFLAVLSTSLSAPEYSSQYGLRLLPRGITLGSYRQIMSDARVFVAYRNTVVRTVLGTSLILLFTVTVAYPLSKRDFPHVKGIMSLVIFSLLFSGGIVPRYLLLHRLGLLNTIWALVVPEAVRAYYVIIMRNFFKAIPQEILDSAHIDGAKESTILVRIVLPLSIPVVAVLALWGAVDHWNAWFDAVVYITTARLEVLQAFLRRTVIEESNFLIRRLSDDVEKYTPESLKAAVLMFVSLPILIVYPFIQRYFVKGIMLGSIKG